MLNFYWLGNRSAYKKLSAEEKKIIQIELLKEVL